MKPAARAIVAAGLVAGLCDLAYVIGLYAIHFPSVGTTRVLQGIAAGAIGREAAGKGGLATAALGLALHFTIALAAAAFFYVLSRRLRGLVTWPWLGGPLYGAGVWLFMNLVVLPLSATPPKAFPPPLWILILVAHVVCVGLPIALVVRRADAKH